jgi:CII-binding regulator of phage lambda lysogenization HflD
MMSEQEANFIVDLYGAIKRRVDEGLNVTLVGLSKDLRMRPSELADYLTDIMRILNAIEEEKKKV